MNTGSQAILTHSVVGMALTHCVVACWYGTEPLTHRVVGMALTHCVVACWYGTDPPCCWYGPLALTNCVVRPLFFYFLVYGFLVRKNGSVCREKKYIGPIISSCRNKLHGHWT